MKEITTNMLLNEQDVPPICKEARMIIWYLMIILTFILHCKALQLFSFNDSTCIHWFILFKCLFQGEKKNKTRVRLKRKTQYTLQSQKYETKHRLYTKS